MRGSYKIFDTIRILFQAIFGHKTVVTTNPEPLLLCGAGLSFWKYDQRHLVCDSRPGTAECIPGFRSASVWAPDGCEGSQPHMLFCVCGIIVENL